MIDCIITEIDTEKRRIAISHKMTLDNPYQVFMDKFPEGSEVNGIVSSLNEYALYVKLDDFEIDGFLHANDLSYLNKPEEELKKFKKGDKIKVKVLEIKKEDQKIRVGLKQLLKDPFEWFQNKKVNDIVTVQVISTDNKGIIVKPESCNLEFLIKKTNIAVNASDARPSRFVGGERIDAAISELNIEKRKVKVFLIIDF